MPKKNWIITTSGERPIGDVEKELRESGFEVGNVLDVIGSITGGADDDVIERARKITGIADIAPDTDIDIGPPGDPLTW